MSALHDRILEISKKMGLTHLGSNLTSVDIIDGIYSVKKEDEPFVLSCGHAGLALYVVIEKYFGIDAEAIFEVHGTHPERCISCRIDCSTGSLGHGLPIAVGMALADRERNVYCLISDGECAEGSIWESINVIRKYDVDNLKLYLNWNGWSAYDRIDMRVIEDIKYMLPQINIVETRGEDYGLKGLSAHYVKL
ncbi:MAG: thiamine pyrophosphate-dependent enzyme [Candidatus Bipolaricaulis sp.]|jgi:transketolase|nr:thiamine pyrophosphate-dependent enzyme [Candidatus Bipolaricaulis sp.]